MGYDDWKTSNPAEVEDERVDDPADQPEDDGPEFEWDFDDPDPDVIPEDSIEVEVV